jgi:replicative DNA helicase
MPHNNDIERAVLAGILREPALIDSAIADKFSANCFYSHINREIWKACSHVRGNGEALDLLSVANCMKMAGTLEKVGGENFLADRDLGKTGS